MIQCMSLGPGPPAEGGRALREASRSLTSREAGLPFPSLGTRFLCLGKHRNGYIKVSELSELRRPQTQTHALVTRAEPNQVPPRWLAPGFFSIECLDTLKEPVDEDAHVQNPHWAHLFSAVYFNSDNPFALAWNALKLDVNFGFLVLHEPESDTPQLLRARTHQPWRSLRARAGC